MMNTVVPEENRSILDFGRADKPFRQVQIDTLLWFEREFEHNDVIVIEAPTASGKSLMVTTIAAFLEDREYNSSLITPTKILQDQYVGDFDYIPVLKGMSEYPCESMGIEGSCRDTKKHLGKCCKSAVDGDGPICNYLIAREIAQHASTALFNFHSYYVNKMYKRVLIADEAHNTIHFLYDFYSMKLWQCEVGYEDSPDLTPTGIKNIIKMAIANLTDYLIDLEAVQSKESEKVEKEIERYEYILMTIDKIGDQLLIVEDTGEYWGKKKDLKGKPQRYIYVKPLKIDKIGGGILWPSGSVEKIILLSATISKEDVKTLGLTGKRVAYYKCPSPIPPERRPFMICNVASMSYKNRTTSFPKIMAAIRKIAAHHVGERGIIHCTYDMSKKIQKEFGKDPRFWFHDTFNKKIQYDLFRESKTNTILVACGMEEGIDLSFDIGRFQIITQLMRPNLEDKVNAWMVKNNISQYNWEAVRKIIQQTGRISRDPTDYGVTYMLDSEFDNFFERSSYLWPQWFISAMRKLNLGA